jgi:hypothetical protein
MVERTIQLLSDLMFDWMVSILVLLRVLLRGCRGGGGGRKFLTANCWLQQRGRMTFERVEGLSC